MNKIVVKEIGYFSFGHNWLFFSFFIKQFFFVLKFVFS